MQADEAVNGTRAAPLKLAIPATQGAALSRKVLG